MKISSLVGFYIKSQRARFLPWAKPLSDEAKRRFAGYFSEDILNEVRVAEGVSLLAMPWVAAMTFDNVIASRVPCFGSLLFHEMVHVTQYRVLGIDQFAEMYVREFLRTRRYEAIPLEACAYELERRFVEDEEPFSVEAEVRARLGVAG